MACPRFQQPPTWLIGAVDGGLLASLAQVDRLPADTLALLTSLAQATPTDFASAVNLALDHAFDVAWALRGPVAPQPVQRTASAWFTARQPLGWIAVSGEDDTPHRPVNSAPPEFEQFDRGHCAWSGGVAYRDCSDAFLHRIGHRGYARHRDSALKSHPAARPGAACAR